MMISRVWYIMPISELLVSFLNSLRTPSMLFILRAVPLHSQLAFFGDDCSNFTFSEYTFM